MPAVATINTNKSSFTVVDTIGGATIKKVYALAQTTSHFTQDAAGNQTLHLMCNGQTAIAAASNPSSEFYGNSIFGTTNPSTAQVAIENNLGAAKGGGVGSIGDCKSGLQAADHDGWVLLDGRTKSSLTAAQQTAATSLGIGTNLPNASGRAFVQGPLGSQIGSRDTFWLNI
jgi:hypothetical protein